MPRDSQGNYTLPSGNPVITGTLITSTWANPTMSDIANEISNSLSRDGQGGMRSPFEFFDGTKNDPGITFTNEPTAGMFRESNGVMGIAAQGIVIARFKGTTGNVDVDAALPIADADLTRKDYVDDQIATIVANSIASNTAAIYEAIYPIGARKIGPDPNGVVPGTWVQEAEGTFLMNTVAGADPSGGDNDAVVVAHTHTGTTNNDTHNHSIPINGNETGTPQIITGGDGGPNVGTDFTNNDTHNHAFTTNSEGVSGVDANKPKYVGVEVWLRTA